MQERRTTIRVAHRCRAEYCPSENLLPRDGYVTSVSERGIGLSLREPHRAGERITVTFPLPGDTLPVTATGVVRWSEPDASPTKRWSTTGLEWLPLEETTRSRLSQFLYQSSQVPSDRPAGGQGLGNRVATRWFVIAAGILSAAFAFFLGSAIVRLHGENRRLQTAVGARDALVDRLAQQNVYLGTALSTTREDLEAAAWEMARLDQHTRGLQEQADTLGREAAQVPVLQGEVQRLADDVEQYQRSYAQVRDERNELMQRVLDLQQERVALSRRLSSIPGLRQAIREAVDARRREQAWQRRLFIAAAREAERQRFVNGNRGYLIRNGQSTPPLLRPAPATPTLQVRVHELEPSASP